MQKDRTSGTAVAAASCCVAADLLGPRKRATPGGGTPVLIASAAARPGRLTRSQH
jgi:hypothetical protein